MILIIEATRDLAGNRFNTQAGEKKEFRYYDNTLRTIQDVLNGRPIDWGGCITADYKIIYHARR